MLNPSQVLVAELVPKYINLPFAVVLRVQEAIDVEVDVKLVVVETASLCPPLAVSFADQAIMLLCFLS